MKLEWSKKSHDHLFCGVTFSLTLTLSRWEREQQLNGFVKFAGLTAEFNSGHAEMRGMFLPLPAGEGRGGRMRVLAKMAADFLTHGKSQQLWHG
ncbi:MAG TPA: hypothetical protein VK742_02645 [Candidatus Sulfotelmatobacter sp.]|nr:hypothetical protein [Candidatus Sulfotelmatobacter sp.]